MIKRRAENIANDLLKKYPSGHDGFLKKRNYTTKEKWCDRYQSYRAFITLEDCSHGNFGYSHEELARVSFLLSPRSWVRETFEDISYTAVSRRSNRLEERLSESNSLYMRGKIECESIFRCEISNVYVYINASSEKTAEQIFKTMFCLSLEDEQKIAWRISRVEPFSSYRLSEFKHLSIKNVEEAIASKNRRIEQTKKSLNDLLMLSSTIEMFNECE